MSAAQNTVAAAMRQAFNLGQTYWRQADSDFTSDHRRSDETRAKFDALAAETAAAHDELAAAVRQVAAAFEGYDIGEQMAAWNKCIAIAKAGGAA